MTPSGTPVSTYRLQLTADFGLDEAAAVVPYLADLGVTHLYCSPWFEAARGSSHGYDVIDHSRVSSQLGGPDALRRLTAACGAAGLGVVLDIVPNHMAVSAPESGNGAWWSVLAEGPSSPYAAWFDIDWEHSDSPGQVVLPVLSGPIGDCLGELLVDGDRIRYYDHEFPIAVGTLVPGDIAATLEGQHYRLCDWRVGGEELNYRRFFDVTELAGVRVEIPEVFEATHRLVLEQCAEGVLQGLRVDHPDGLADPAGYLERLAKASGGRWTVVEKILQGDEPLPPWPCAGTTGYELLNAVTGLFIDPTGAEPLIALWTAETGDEGSFTEIATRAKRQILDELLATEVTQLTEAALALCRRSPALRDTVRRRLREALTEVLASCDVYRAYIRPGVDPGADDKARADLDRAARRATLSQPDRAREIAAVIQLALGEGPQGADAEAFVIRFQQTCGPVMAKGVEDTAFYRYLPLLALNEVGGNPGAWGRSAAAFHETCARVQREWPLTMTTLSTHDTKRSEDVRARLALLSQLPAEWAETVGRLGDLVPGHASRVDGPTRYLFWQTVVGAWPLPAERARDYLRKATREAKRRTSWLTPDDAFEQDLDTWVDSVLADAAVTAEVARFVDRLREAWEATALAQKLVQLTMPGVADTYQGCEHWDLSLVDPDNRRPVDFAARRQLLAAPRDEGSAKLHLVATALRLRRENPSWFLGGSSYEPLVTGPRALGFVRSGRVATVVPLRSADVCDRGWGDETVTLPAGTWQDAVTGRAWPGGELGLGDLLDAFPVALLVSPDATEGMGPL